MGNEPDPVVGLIADPDFPQLVAEQLAEDLGKGDATGQKWTVRVEIDPITAGRNDSADMLLATRGRMEHNEWDYAICLTDLPLRATDRPILAEADIGNQVALVSLPAMGGAQPYRRSRQIITQLLNELTERQPSDKAGSQYGLRSKLTQLLAPIHREKPDHDEIDVRYRATRIRGRIRLLTGMVRTNRPWRLVFGLTSALAAAVATSAFGLSSSTIWQIGDQLETWRQIVAAFGSVGVLVFWLIAAHNLWERKKNHGHDRIQATLYNCSTILTLTIGVSFMYITLFAINIGIAAFLIKPSLLASNLSHAASWSSYGSLAWAFTTMGVIAGALGSSLESDAAVRQAAYGYREEQRRRAEHPT